ncbi:MAG TPA: Sll0314/Alr1548 family TPR repeat-containing protein [Nostocaceae cyanobacterium]|nr:Sll0314/Alr1548 family TPR repeat-containing protein [Nostocaceae cyanobacterium]
MFKNFLPFTRLAKLTLLSAIALNLWVSPAFAGDPFRTKDPKKIGDQTEAAFKAIFQQGDYSAAEKYLEQAQSKEPNEPLVYALKASLAYGKNDLAALEKYSKKTLEVGQKLTFADPLRGNLYTGVGHFLEGATIITREGAVNGASSALSRLRKVYQYFDQAEAIAPKDPELNLIRGYMDLMLSVNLPFASPEQAIERLEKNAAPGYLVYRGIALAYRDLKQYQSALNYANQAVNATPSNPEIYYLRAQIYHELAKPDNNKTFLKEAIANFDKALAKKSQLPASLVRQIESERKQATQRLQNR